MKTELGRISEQLPEVGCLKEEECCPDQTIPIPQGCSSPLVVEDFKPFHSNEKVMKKIVRRAVEQRLLGPDSSLLACPSPNCEGVFRRFLFDF